MQKTSDKSDCRSGCIRSASFVRWHADNGNSVPPMGPAGHQAKLPSKFCKKQKYCLHSLMVYAKVKLKQRIGNGI
jgi:hypothetical protein